MNAATVVSPPAGEPVALQIRRTARQGALAVLVWVLLLGAWATWAPIAGGIVAAGLVKVEANRRVVSHRDGGIVAHIAVHEGQVVQAGELLLALEDARIDATMGLLRTQVLADRLRRSRLEAETQGASHWQVPEALLAEFGDLPARRELAQRERGAFEHRQASLQTQLGGAQAQSEAVRQEIAARERERDRAGRSLAAMREELAMNRQLEREQYVHRARLMTLERAVSDYEAQVASAEAELSQARQRLRGFEAQAGTQRETRRQSAAEELREVEARLADNEQRLYASRDDQQRQRVLAPVAGRLINLRVNTPGSAIGPREPLVEIVPLDAPVLVEARLPLDEAADVRPGLAADLRLAGQQARHQRLWPAEVVQVGADAQEDERSGRPYVRVLLRAQAQSGRDATPLQPGQAAEVYLRVSERTPLGFLVEPVSGFFRRAFRGA